MIFYINLSSTLPGLLIFGPEGERLRLFQALAEGEGESTITTTSTAPAPAKGSTGDAADAVDLPGAVLDPPGSVPEPPLKRAVTVHVP